MIGSIKRYIALAAVTLASVGAVAAIEVAVPATAAMHHENIVQTAAEAGQFKTLIKLAQRAGLASALEAKGPLTVFAPTDAAFAKVPRQTVRYLERHPSKLRAVLLYHVLMGRLTAAKLLKLHWVKTLNGQYLAVRVKHGEVTVNGIRVIKANVHASNGLIHVIAGVLIPR